MAVLVEIGADEKPIPPALGPLGKLAVMWCKDPNFRAFFGCADEDEAKQYILDACGVDSRKEIDSNPEAKRKFNEIRISFVNGVQFK